MPAFTVDGMSALGSDRPVSATGSPHARYTCDKPIYRYGTRTQLSRFSLDGQLEGGPDTDEPAAKRRKSSKSDQVLLAKFKGQFPASLQKVMAGEAVNQGAGFHKIALQVAITGNALGKKEDEILAACEGLIEKHQSDGHRYNTPIKRRNEILRLVRYTEGNPCYEYSRDALRSIVDPTVATPDLDGVSEEVAGEVTAEGDNGNSEGLLGGVFVSEKGVFRAYDRRWR